ncbi:hypothetical protein KUV73_04005 [Mameliella alba]|nr:hypothetical protein [Mameliella alba]MBY6168490.1 hypothetical protein [Mameliella alba]MBY6173509.1 hypothetical protein [Mameliella alba]
MTVRARFVTCATALALHRGGMSWASHLLVALAGALEALPELSGVDDLRPIRAAADSVMAARLAGDAPAYDAARLELELRLGLYWELKAKGLAA